MRSGYRDWLQRQGYDAGTVQTQLSRAARIEQSYGSLDQHYANDRLRSLISTFAYSVDDARNGRANPTKLQISGDLRNNLASYKSTLLWYARYCEAPSAEGTASEQITPRVSTREPRKTFEVQPGAKTLRDFGLDGRAALEAIISGSQYGTMAQAVASLTLFSHPDTVRQTEGRALFPTVRDQRRVGQYDVVDGRVVMLDDNRSPTAAFLWANNLTRRGSDTQFNHVYASSLDPDAYCALPNICMTPAFIAKLTDTSEEVRALLKYRSFKLYGWTPRGQDAPTCPANYEVLEWAAPLPPVTDVKATLERAMLSKPKDRTVVAARRLGWLFGTPVT